MGIVFEAFTPEAPATGLGLWPSLRGFGVVGDDTYIGHGRMPALRQAVASGIKAPQRLAALRQMKLPFAAPQRLPALRGRGSVTPIGGGVGYGRLPALVGFGSVVSAVPQITLGFGTLPALVGFGAAKFEMASTALGKLAALRGRAIVGDAGLNPWGAGVLPALQGFGFVDRTGGGGWISVLQSAGLAYMTGSDAPILLVNETVRMGGALDVAWIQSLQDRLRIASTPLALLDALARVSEALTFKDMVSIAYAMLVQESVSIGGSPTASLRHALQLADALTLISGTGSALDAQVTVATAFALADSLASVYPNALAENVDLSGTVAATLRATLQLLDAMRVQDGVTPGMTWLVQTDETFELTDANATTATLGMLLADGIEMLGELRFEDGAYLAWVVNTETRAFVKYRNFPFNSFAGIGESYFGCGADGIYKLGGDDDAGEPITAVLRGGLTDLGSSLLKNMPAAYIGYRAADQMVLKVTVMAVQKNGDIERQEHWYRMEPRQANAIRENRVKLGRGLKSTYWGWELTNINGADFDVDSFSWYPVVLERRLN